MPEPNDQLPKVEFTAEQQAKVQELIDKAHSAALKKHNTELVQSNTKTATLEAELAAAQADLERLKAAPATKVNKDDAAAFQAQIEEMKNAQRTLLEDMARNKQALAAKEQEIAKAKAETTHVRKSNLIQKEAAALGFVSPEIVAKVTEDALSWDEQKGRFVVLGPNGEPRLNAAYDEMTPTEYYKEFAVANPYLVRSDVRPGNGSTGSKQFGGSSDGKLEVKQVFGKDSSSVLATKLMKEAPADYKRMKLQAQEMGLIPK